MKILKYIILLILACLISCSDEPEQYEYFSIQPLIQSVCVYDSKEFNAPEKSPEYIIINSEEDLAELPEGYVSEITETVFQKVNFAKKTLIVVTSAIYCQPDLGDDDWNWAMADYVLKKDYSLNILYSNCSVEPNAEYSEKCKIQFGFTTDKISSDTLITISER